jgi:hypothetical protein
MKVDIGFSDVSVVFECECGARIYGDSAVDAFKSWWQHAHDKHNGV